MLIGGQPKYQRYRAPRANDSMLVVPSIEELKLSPPCSGMALEFGDASLGDLRAAARHELVAAATEYTASYRDLPSLPTGPAPLLLSGHQAELFHPGVWFKNFMLSRLAADRQAVGIHLVIDTDVMHTTGIRVPTGTTDNPRIEAVPIDAVGPSVPMEQRTIVDGDVFATFGSRVRRAIGPLIEDPLVGQWWPSVVAAAVRTDGKLGLAIAQARHQLEAAWSAATLEVPMSRCCGFRSFQQFTAALLLDHGRVHKAYNQSLAAYRQAHHLRSHAQPMPDLAVEGDWIETPFWVWTEDQPLRKPLFARRRGSRLALSDGETWKVEIEPSQGDPQESVAEWLADLATTGTKIRTRALTTTLFARLVLGDLFLHGIGGAKYDEVTDDLVRRLWGCSPPPYLALSATLLLPIEHQHVGEDELRRVRGQLRACEWHPERFLSHERSAAVSHALAEKCKWIQVPKTPNNAEVRHQAIEAANAGLRSAVSNQRHALLQREHQLVERARATAVLESREYAFCLYPGQDLRERMWQLVDRTFEHSGTR